MRWFSNAHALTAAMTLLSATLLTAQQPPTPPFTDFRYQKPGASHKITVTDALDAALRERVNFDEVCTHGRVGARQLAR